MNDRAQTFSMKSLTREEIEALLPENSATVEMPVLDAALTKLRNALFQPEQGEAARLRERLESEVVRLRADAEDGDDWNRETADYLERLLALEAEFRLRVYAEREKEEAEGRATKAEAERRMMDFERAKEMDRAERAESVLEGLAVELKERADEAEAKWQVNKDEPKLRAAMRAIHVDAALARRKADALKGGKD